MGEVAIRTVPACGVDLVRSFEGLHDGDKRTPTLEPEPDLGGIYTVGYGYALFSGGVPVRDRETAYRMWRRRWPTGLLKADAERLLLEVCQDICGKVLRLLHGVALNDHELGALVCLSYNIGTGEEGGVPDFADSTVRRKILAGDRKAAAEAFLMWRFVKGREIPGLLRRRKAERELFLRPCAASS